jgi:hypothetical protein
VPEDGSKELAAEKAISPSKEDAGPEESATEEVGAVEEGDDKSRPDIPLGASDCAVISEIFRVTADLDDLEKKRSAEMEADKPAESVKSSAELGDEDQVTESDVTGDNPAPAIETPPAPAPARKVIGAFKNLVDINFLIALGPPGGGRNPLTSRIVRHFNILTFCNLQDESKERIFNTILQNHLSSMPGGGHNLSVGVTKATIKVSRK